MVMRVVGVRKVDYFSKKNQKQVHGYDLYVEYETDEVMGVKAESLFLGEDRFGGFLDQFKNLKDLVGEDFVFDFNTRGFLERISLVG